MSALFKGLTFLACCLVFTVQSANVEVQKIVAKPFSQQIKVKGKTQFKRKVNLAFKRSGYLASQLLETGAEFHQGQKLAWLDNTELLEDKNAKYAQLIQAKKDLARIQELVKQELASEQDIDNAKTQLELARSAYQVAYYNVEKAKIIAPFDGVIVQRFTAKGELQVAGNPVYQIAAYENNQIVEVYLTESALSSIALGSEFTIQFYQHTQPVKAVVDSIAPNADMNGLFAIKLLLKSDNSHFKAGIFAEIILQQSSDSETFAIPYSALVAVTEAGHAKIYVQNKAKQFRELALPIVGQDNHYIYLMNSANQSPLSVVTQGWQQLQFKVTE